jgi:Flp pilus assembly protein TadG
MNPRRDRYNSGNRGESHGQGSVELALALPLMVAMLMVLVEAGHICLISVSLGSAARAGVQYGAQSLTTVKDSTGMISAAKADAPNLASMTVTATYHCVCSNGGASTCLSSDCSTSHRLTYVTVSTSAQYTPWFNWPGVPATTTLTSQATMRANQ